MNDRFIDKSSRFYYQARHGRIRGEVVMIRRSGHLVFFWACLALLIASLVPVIGPPIQAQSGRYGHTQSIYLTHFYCNSIQKDSAFNSKNELGLVITTQVNGVGKEPYRFSRTFPNPGLYNMQAGQLYSVSHNNGRIWSGEATGLFVAGAVIEVDDRPRLKRRTVGRINDAAVSRVFPKSYFNASERNMDALRFAYRRALRNILAPTEDDYAGADIFYINGENQSRDIDWGESEFLSDRIRSRFTNASVSYHFKLRMQGGGADCIAYFRFDDAKKFGSWPGDSGGTSTVKPSNPLNLRQDHVCLAQGRKWHVKGRNVVRYLGGGGRTTDGFVYTPRDPGCQFEFDISKGRSGTGSYCVADRGRLRRGNSGGARVGTCYQCDGDECLDATRPSGGQSKARQTSYSVGRDLVCRANGKAYHLTGDRIYSHDGINGKRLYRGDLFTARDKNCHFELHMLGTLQRFCMGDYGAIWRNNSKGPRVGSCKACSGERCKEQ